MRKPANKLSMALGLVGFMSFQSGFVLHMQILSCTRGVCVAKEFVQLDMFRFFFMPLCVRACDSKLGSILQLTVYIRKSRVKIMTS